MYSLHLVKLFLGILTVLTLTGKIGPKSLEHINEKLNGNKGWVLDGNISQHFLQAGSEVQFNSPISGGNTNKIMDGNWSITLDGNKTSSFQLAGSNKLKPKNNKK